MSAIVADSSIWVSVLTRAPGHERYLPLMKPPNQLMVPAIVVYEVVRWSLVHKDEPSAEAARQILENHELVMIDGEIAGLAATIAAEHRLAMADALIFATAKLHGAELWTQDADFAGLPGVKLFPKL